MDDIEYLKDAENAEDSRHIGHHHLALYFAKSFSSTLSPH